MENTPPEIQKLNILDLEELTTMGRQAYKWVKGASEIK